MAESSEIGAYFGANLRRVRKQVGMSQEALAFRAGLHRTEIGLLERGERTPRIDTLIKLAGGLGVDPVLLLEGIEWNEGQRTAGAFRLGPEGQGE